MQKTMLLSTPVCSASELASVVRDPRIRVIDCRFDLADAEAGRRAFGECRVPGARYAHLDDDLSALVHDRSLGRHPLPGLEDMATRLADLGLCPEHHVVVYDNAGGAIAARLWWMLRRLGHDAVSVLDGGWPAWEAGGFPVETGPEAGSRDDEASGPCTSWSPPPGRQSMEATAARVVVAAAQGRLYDARAAERYAGEVEPIDPVAGHIPGAHSLPFAKSLQDNGMFRPKSEIQPLWAAHPPGTGDHAGPSVVYCGSGVTACHLILSAMYAGLAEPALYAPSWSGWISDPARGVETGMP